MPYLGSGIRVKTLDPIERFSATAKRIGQSQTFEKIDLDGALDELKDLGEVLNQSFENLHQALEQQRHFVADASHELRTPLSSILLELEALVKQNDDPKALQEGLENCLSSTEHLMDLIEKLLMCARSDIGEVKLNLQPIHLDTIILNVVHMLKRKASKKDIQIETCLDSIYVKLDAERFKQAISNLVNNTIAHCPQGTTCLISAQSKENQAHIIVEDNGPGIDNTAIEHIFDRYLS